VRFLTSLIRRSRQPARRAEPPYGSVAAEPVQPVAPMDEALTTSSVVPHMANRPPDPSTAAETSSSGAAVDRPKEERPMEPPGAARPTESRSTAPAIEDGLIAEAVSAGQMGPETSSPEADASGQAAEPFAEQPMASEPGVAAGPSPGKLEAVSEPDEPPSDHPDSNDSVRPIEPTLTPTHPSVEPNGQSGWIPGLPEQPNKPSSPVSNPSAEESEHQQQVQAPAGVNDATGATSPATRPQTTQAPGPDEPERVVLAPYAPLNRPYPPRPAPFERPQNSPKEPPQVRIGQINVLVEEQTAAKPRQSRSGPDPRRANPFGVRGL
jgi:hypothetical protein